jgi:hypothetical protein
MVKTIRKGGPGHWGVSRMGGVIRFERPTASAAVIASLVALGYLQQAKRHRDTAIKGRSRGCGAISSAQARFRRATSQLSRQGRTAAASPLLHARPVSDLKGNRETSCPSASVAACLSTGPI